MKMANDGVICTYNTLMEIYALAREIFSSFDDLIIIQNQIHNTKSEEIKLTRCEKKLEEDE